MKEGGDIAVNVGVWGKVNVLSLGSIDRIVYGESKFEVMMKKIIWVSEREAVAEGTSYQPVDGVEFPFE